MLETNALENIEVKISSAISAEETALGNEIKQQQPVSAGYSKAALDQMVKARIGWEDGPLRASNKQLYAILQQVKGFCGDLPSAEAKQRSATLEAFYKERGWRYNKETPLETRVIRAVFGNVDRRRDSGYSIVLREAKKQRVSILDLPDWIESNGGIQEIRLSQSKNFISPSDKSKVMKERLASHKFFIGFAKSDLLSFTADAEFTDDDCVLLANQQADGSFGIYAVLRSDGVMNAAYLAAYSKSDEIEAQAKKEIEAANDADGQPVAA
jgi:hypothetical protein